MWMQGAKERHGELVYVGEVGMEKRQLDAPAGRGGIQDRQAQLGGMVAVMLLRK